LEAAGMHYVLPAKLAWIFTILSVYGGLWMIAMARSFSALPLVVDAEGITLRKGLLSALYVPRDAIAAVSREPLGKGFAPFALLAEPTVWISFRQPLTVELPMGFARQVHGAAVAPDDASGFLSALNES